MPDETRKDPYALDDLERFVQDVQTRLQYGLPYDISVKTRWPARVATLVRAIEELERRKIEHQDRLEELQHEFLQSPIGQIAKHCAATMLASMRRFGRHHALTEYDCDFVDRFYRACPHLRPKGKVGRSSELAPHFSDIARKYDQFMRFLDELRGADEDLKTQCERNGRIHSNFVRELLRSDKILVPWALWDMPEPPFLRTREPDAFDLARGRFIRCFQRLVFHLRTSGLLHEQRFEDTKTLPDALFKLMSELLGYGGRGRKGRKGGHDWFCEYMSKVTGASSRTVAQRIDDDRNRRL